MYCDWKENREEAAEHYEEWWKGDGMVVSIWGSGLNVGRALDETIPAMDPSWTPSARHDSPRLFAQHEQRRINRERFPLDIVPFAYVDYGTVPLAELLGATAEPREHTVWYTNCGLTPDNDRELRFDAAHPAWLRMTAVADEGRRIADNHYLIGAPALCPGLDVLAELCGSEELMVDLVTNSEWVHRKLSEIQQASYAAMEALTPHTVYPDGSSFHAFFMLWAPERTALAQCDAAALISPQMFEEFNIPYLQDFCRHVDRVLYHVDGPEALDSLDQVLQVDELDAVEFTPGPQVPRGGDPHWYDMYRKIKEAGKRLQAVWVDPPDVEPLLNAIGTAGTYVEVALSSMEEAEELERIVARYR